MVPALQCRLNYKFIEPGSPDWDEEAWPKLLKNASRHLGGSSDAAQQLLQAAVDNKRLLGMEQSSKRKGCVVYALHSLEDKMA